MKQYLSHGFQLSLFILIGRLELPHPLHQVILLHMLPLPELSAPQPGLTVRRWQSQPQQLDARLNSLTQNRVRRDSLIDLPQQQSHYSCTVESVTVK